MKKKYQYQRIVYALNEWKKRLIITDISPAVCSKALIERILSEYECWSVSHLSHCCYGWQRMCWCDEFAEGLWELTAADMEQHTKTLLLSCRAESHRMPIFYINEKADRISILITYRHKDSCGCKDYEIYGKKRK